MKTALRSFGLAFALALATPLLPGCGGGDDGQTGDAQDVQATAGKFETFVGQDGQHYFQLVAGNGERVLRSEGYTTLQSAKKGIASVRKNGTDVANFEVLETASGESYFNLVAGNGEIIGTSETYASASNADRAVKTVVGLLSKASEGAATTGNAKFDTFQGQDGKHYFNLRAGNGQVVLQSQGYASSSGAKKGIESVKTNGVDFAQFEILEAQNGQAYFVLAAKNHEIIGRGEMYASLSNATRGAETVQALLRGLAGATKSDAEVKGAIEKGAAGALYPSESDYAFDYVTADLGGKASEITEELVRAKLASYVDGNEDADGPLADLFGMSGNWSEWKTDYSDCGEDEYPGPAECKEIQELNAALETNLTGLRIYYFGRDGEPGAVDGVAVTVFVVGLTPQGNLAGVRTLAIWT